MRILVACEESQAVTKELRRLGHEAYSCDIVACSGGHPEWHIMQDVLPLLNPSQIPIWDGNTTIKGIEFKTCDGKWIGWNDPRTAKYRSKTYPGIAKAMAEQWAGEAKGGNLNENQT